MNENRSSADATPRPGARTGQNVIFLLFLCSGVSGLIYEVVWTRLLTVVLGNTVFAVSAVLTVYMGGLALGSFCAGRIIDRRTDPLRVYALLEIAIGAFGFCSSLLLIQTGPAYVWLHRTLGEYPALLHVMRYVFSFVLLGLPTTLMGATLPVLSRFAVDRQSVVGLKVGTLYAINTLGAAAGCYAAGFILIGNVGIHLTILSASVLSIIVGLVAWSCDRRLSVAAPLPSAAPADGNGEETPRSALRWLILGAFALSGLTALSYEVIWTRILILFLSNTVYAFAAMLTTFLAGVGLGSLVFSSFVDRRKLLVLGLGLMEAAIGFYALLSIYVFGHAEALLAFGQNFPEWKGTGAGFTKALALMLVPTFLFGGTFPIAARICSSSFARIGARVGELYSWNTVGAIVGAAATGFVLMPLLGLQGSLLTMLCLNLLVGIALCGAEPGLTRKDRSLLVCCLVALTVLGMAKSPRDVFRYMQETWVPSEKLVYYREDPAGTVCVRQIGRERKMYVDGLDVAGTEPIYLGSSKFLGHVPMLIHRNPKRAFVLGFGAGGTSHAISTYPSVVRIDAAEICRSVTRAARLFPEVHHGVLSNPKLRLMVNDGRHFLLTTSHKYDVISVDLSLPASAGAASLYTREFYALCRQRLDDGGLIVQWLPPGMMSLRYLQVILRTAREVFPHVGLWSTRFHEHLMMVASGAAPAIDYELCARRMTHPGVRRDLAEIGIRDPDTFLSYFIAAGEAVAGLAAGGDRGLNTDDLPRLEYRLPFRPDFPPRLENFSALKSIRRSVVSLLVNLDEGQKERVLEAESSTRRAFDSVLAQDYCNWGSWLLDRGRHREGMAAYEKALLTAPHDASVLTEAAMTFEALGRADEALERYTQALALQPDNPDLNQVVGAGMERRGKLAEAAKYYSAALRLNANHVDSLTGLASILATSQDREHRDGPRAVELAERACGIIGRSNPRALDVLAASYAEAGRFAEAASTAQRALELLHGRSASRAARAVQERIELYRKGRPYRRPKAP